MNEALSLGEAAARVAAGAREAARRLLEAPPVILDNARAGWMVRSAVSVTATGDALISDSGVCVCLYMEGWRGEERETYLVNGGFPPMQDRDSALDGDMDDGVDRRVAGYTADAFTAECAAAGALVGACAMDPLTGEAAVEYFGTMDGGGHATCHRKTACGVFFMDMVLHAAAHHPVFDPELLEEARRRRAVADSFRPLSADDPRIWIGPQPLLSLCRLYIEEAPSSALGNSSRLMSAFANGAFAVVDAPLEAGAHGWQTLDHEGNPTANTLLGVAGRYALPRMRTFGEGAFLARPAAPRLANLRIIPKGGECFRETPQDSGLFITAVTEAGSVDWSAGRISVLVDNAWWLEDGVAVARTGGFHAAIDLERLLRQPSAVTRPVLARMGDTFSAIRIGTAPAVLADTAILER